VSKRDGIWSWGGGAGFGNWVLQGVFKARCGFLGFGVGGCGFLGWRAWVLSVGVGSVWGFFLFFKSYFGKRGGGGFKIYLYFLGLGDMGFRVLEDGVFGFFYIVLVERGGGGC
jgi:hypothetical protein